MKSALLRPALPGFVLCASLLLAACTTPYSEAPVATNFPTSKQHKLQAGAHWEAIARDSATNLITAMRLGKGCIAAYPDCHQLVLRAPREYTPFSRAFHTLLTTSLVNQGVQIAAGNQQPGQPMISMPRLEPIAASPVAASPRTKTKTLRNGKRVTVKTPRPIAVPTPALASAMPTPLPPALPLRQELEVDIQVVKFSPDRLDGRYFVSGTALGAGAWGLHGLWTQTSPQGAAAGVLLGATFDAHRWFSSEFARGPLPQLEMIITVSALSQGQYIGRVSNVYYLTDSDLSLYVPLQVTPVVPLPSVVNLNGGF